MFWRRKSKSPVVYDLTWMETARKRCRENRKQELREQLTLLLAPVVAGQNFAPGVYKRELHRMVQGSVDVAMGESE